MQAKIQTKGMMAPPDTRKVIGGLAWARADAVSHDAKRICGAGLGEKSVPGTVLDVEHRKPEDAKRSVTCIKASYKIGNIAKEKTLAMQSLKAQDPSDQADANATTTTAGTTENSNENPSGGQSGDVDNDDGVAAGTTTTTAATTATTPTPGGGSGEEESSTSSASGGTSTTRTPVATSNDGREWFDGDVFHDGNGPTTVKVWKMVCQWTGNEFTQGFESGTVPKCSELDCFMACFPKTQLVWMLNNLNSSLVANDKKPSAIGELLKWFGVLMLMTRFECGDHSSLWSDQTTCKCMPPPCFGKTGMSRNRFHDMFKCLKWSEQSAERPEDMSHEHCRWCLVQDFVDRVNEHRSTHFCPSDIVCVDESISRWCGLGGSWINTGLPMHVAMDRKPEAGCEMQDSCCGKSQIIMRLKLVKSAAEEEAEKQVCDSTSICFFHSVKNTINNVVVCHLVG